MSLFLGVDAGGTKTALCLITGGGEVIGTVETGSLYYLSEGIELVGRVLSDGIAQICEVAGVSAQQIDRAFMGLPSYGEVSSDIPVLDALPRGVLGHDRYECDNDMVCAWAGSLAAADGINVIAGTGSIAYGEHVGRRARVGGWGELFGDEGSGYWIATEGLRAFAKMSDGRLPPGPLHRLLEEHLQLERDLDLVGVILDRWNGDRRRIAALSTVVAAAAEQEDRI